MKRFIISLIPVLLLSASAIACAGSSDVPAPEELTEDQFILDGTFYSGHISMKDLLSDGWKLDQRDESKEYEPGDSSGVINTRSVSLTKGDLKIEAAPYNGSTEMPCTIEETEILMVSVDKDAGVSLFVGKGMSFDATEKTIREEFGEDLDVFEGSDYTEYKVPKRSTRIIFRIEGNNVKKIKIWIPRK